MMILCIFFAGIKQLDDIIPMFLANPAFIAGFLACFMDNTIPGK